MNAFGYILYRLDATVESCGMSRLEEQGETVKFEAFLGEEYGDRTNSAGHSTCMRIQGG